MQLSCAKHSRLNAFGMSDLAWDERRRPGGVRVIAYAGPRATTTRFGAGLLVAVCAAGFLWIARRHVAREEPYPPWVDVLLIMLFIAGVVVALVSAPGSPRGRIELVENKLQFIERGFFAGSVDVVIRDVAGFSADGSLDRYNVYATLRSSVRVKLATFGTLNAANEMVAALEALAMSLRS
jgi:hypothetical protein